MPNILACKVAKCSSSDVALEMVGTQLSPKNGTLSHLILLKTQSEHQRRAA